MSTVSALWNAASVIMSRGLISFSTSFMICMPVSFARRILAENGAGIVPLPRSAIPIASVRQFMELAVYIPEHDPHEGHACSTYDCTPSSSSLPAWYAPTASNMCERQVRLPSGRRPASIGPPAQNMVGTLIRAAAISRPGTFLSQLGTMTSPSN